MNSIRNDMPFILLNQKPINVEVKGEKGAQRITQIGQLDVAEGIAIECLHPQGRIPKLSLVDSHKFVMIPVRTTTGEKVAQVNVASLCKHLHLNNEDLRQAAVLDTGLHAMINGIIEATSKGFKALKEGNFKNALIYFEQAAKTGSPEAHLGLAAAYSALNNGKEASACCRKAADALVKLAGKEREAAIKNFTGLLDSLKSSNELCKFLFNTSMVSGSLDLKIFKKKAHLKDKSYFTEKFWKTV